MLNTDISLFKNASSRGKILNLPVVNCLLTAFVICFKVNLESSNANKYLIFGF